MPVIILSAKHDEIDVVLGLEIGADDYIAKPFRPRELLARIGAHLRRAKELRGDDKPADGRLVFRDLVIDTAERRVTRVRPRHRAHPYRVRPPLVPRFERRQGALPRADPQRGLGLRAPDRDARDRRARSEPAPQDRARSRRNRATSSPSPGSDTASPGSAAEVPRGCEVTAKYTRHRANPTRCSIHASQARRPGGPIPFRPITVGALSVIALALLSAAVLATYTYSTPNVELPLVIADRRSSSWSWSAPTSSGWRCATSARGADR